LENLSIPKGQPILRR